MTYPATTYAEGVELTITSGNQLHEIINGDANEEISTESGMVPSVRKALADAMLFKPAIAWSEGSVESDPFQTRLFGEGIYWAPSASNETPISMGSDPSIDSNWFLAPVTGGESIASNTNLLSNHNFLVQSPDNITQPSATPTDYISGTQVFSGIFVGEDIVGLTHIDGRVSWDSGTLYFSVPNTSGLEYVDESEFVASVADFDGKPRTRGVSFALVGDEYRVTVGVDALEDESANVTLLGSVKFEQGKVATGHEVQSTKGQSYTFNTVAEMTSNGAPVGSKVQWLGYFAPSDGGSNWGTVKKGAHVEDGFSIFSIDENTYIEANLAASGRWSVMKAGAMSADPAIARQAVQTVYDYPLNGRTVYWPKYNYVFTPPGVGVPVFTVTRNVSTKGEETRGVSIRIDGADSQTDIFEIGITSNGGFLDVRSWEFKNMSMFFNGSGRHCIRKINTGGALPMFNAEISHCTLAANFDNNGRSIQIDGGWAFSHVRMCDLNNGITAENIADGNKFAYNNISGKGWGIILRIISGAYKTKAYGGTIVTRDGALWVKTGSQVDIDGIQIEQDASEGVNQDPISSHIYIHGDSYRSNSVKITNCNFGGGTNVNNLIYLDKCSNAIIDNNFGNAPNPSGYDIVMTSQARFNKVMKTNRWRGNVSNPRTTDRMNAVISDSGRGNYGVLKDLSALTFLNGWSATGNYYKDPETGEVIILGSFSGGALTAGSAVADFPNGFRPDAISNYPALCDAGLFTANMSIQAGSLGRLRVGSSGNAPSNVGAFEGLKYFAQGDDEFTTS